MKKIHLIICMIMFAMFQAQIVNIPDPIFKAKLLSANTTTNYQIALNSLGQTIKIDTNNNGEIEVSEANNVWSLHISDYNITNLTGIQSFSNLNSLHLFGLKAQAIDVSGMTALNVLDINGLDQFTNLNITNCPSLQTLTILSCDALTSLNLISNSLKKISLFSGILNQLNITNCPALQNISVQATKISNLDLSNLHFLKEVDLSSNSQLQNINFQGCDLLYRISLASNGHLSSVEIANLPTLWILSCLNNYSLGTITASNCPMLERLELTSNDNLSNLIVSGLPKLQILDISNNHFSSIDVSSLSTLKLLRCSENQLLSLDLSHNTSINQLQCDRNLLQTLDLSHNPALYSLNCSYNNLKAINLKNGTQTFPSSLSISDNPQLQFLCCDDNKVSYISNILINYGYNNVVVNSYCSFTPGGSFYSILGNTKYDSNNNGCDINDLNKAFQRFTITNGSISGNIIANSTGNYSIPVQSGNHTITPVLENPTYFNVSPTSATVNFPTQSSPLTQNFCLTAIGTHNDLEVFIIPVTAASPGFEAQYKMVYKNKGTTAQSGNIVFNFNDDLMNYATATVAPNSQSTGTINWNFTNLLPFETKEILLTFTLNTPTQTPALHGGDILHYTVQINGANDETPADNHFVLNQTVVNSFDPNDKTCLEGASISQTQVGEYVHYLIRFENTGTANALNIVVKDEIDTSKFDLSTLVPLNGSHNFITRTTHPNVVEFIFENIQLPFDDAHNDGYISFKIKTKSTLVSGNSFSNTAKIYFDYNAPIITNTYTTNIGSTLGTSENNVNKDIFSIYPNPAKDILFMTSKEKVIKTEIYDTAGRILTSASLQENSVNISELTKGTYFIKVFTKDQSSVKKFIKN